MVEIAADLLTETGESDKSYLDQTLERLSAWLAENPKSDRKGRDYEKILHQRGLFRFAAGPIKIRLKNGQARVVVSARVVP